MQCPVGSGTNRPDVSAAAEVERLRQRAARAGIRLLEKSHACTHWPGSDSSLEPGDLDHSVATGHLPIRGDLVQVRGWVDRRTNRGRDGWRRKYSDHALLWVEVG